MRKSRLAWTKQSELIDLFVDGTSTRVAAQLARVNKNTANTYFNRLRLLIYQQSPEPGFLEADIDGDNQIIRETVNWVRSKRNVRPFGLVFSDRKVHIALLADGEKLDKPYIIRDRLAPDYLFFYHGSLGKSCASVKQVSGRSSLRIYQCSYHGCPMKTKFGANNFCNFFSTQQKKCFGIPDKYFYLYLKELEWKFNNPDQAWQKEQLTHWAMKDLG